MDTTKIKVGDKILLRNGDIQTITHVSVSDSVTWPVEVYWQDNGHAYTADGFFWENGDEDSRDIVDIIPAEPPEKPTDDPINPSHYTKGDSTYGYIKSWKMNYEEGCIVKYVTRWRHKNPANAVEDLEKARWYLDELITRAETEGVENV